MTEQSPRVTEHPISDVFTSRWSPRAFDGSAMEEGDLLRLFEAARWAPSAFNVQPWRFLYALRGTPDFDRFLDLLIPFNQSWAGNASALVFVLSDSVSRDEEGKAKGENYSHTLDTGAAWGQLAMQAVHDGLYTHGMTGVDFDKARTELNVPEEFRIEMAIAIGRMGDVSSLPDYLQEREAPSDRMPLSQLAFPGNFPA